MADYVPPEEMAEIVKEVISLSDCDDCNQSLSHEGRVEDIELDPGNPNDFKKFLKHIATVHVEGGIAEAEEYIKKLGEAYGQPVTITTDAKQTAKDWLNKKYEQHQCDHQHDHDPDAIMGEDGKMQLPDDFDTTPMVVVDDNDNFRMYCVAGKVEEQLKQLSNYTNVKGWRALTHEEFEKLNQGL